MCMEDRHCLTALLQVHVPLVDQTQSANTKPTEPKKYELLHLLKSMFSRNSSNA